MPSIMKNFSKMFAIKPFHLVLFTLIWLTLFPSLALAASNDKIGLEIYGWKLGEFDPTGSSLPVITFVVALIDGFNPCAMWVLLFLISLLLEMKETWKRWYLGGVFLLTSGISYFLFLASWLKINEFIGLIPLTRALIALAAWVVGFWSINQYLKHRGQQTGCEVGEKEERRQWFIKIKQAIQNKNVIWSTLGIIGIAFSVNLFELLCSAALPATYTNVLAAQSVEGVWKIAYLLLYVLIFMLDDLLVFSVAMITLHATGITTKYNNLIKLISGVIMLLLAGWITLEVLQGFQIL